MHLRNRVLQFCIVLLLTQLVVAGGFFAIQNIFFGAQNSGFDMLGATPIILVIDFAFLCVRNDIEDWRRHRQVLRTTA